MVGVWLPGISIVYSLWIQLFAESKCKVLMKLYTKLLTSV